MNRASELPDFVWSRIQHENELLNHRLTWMWTLQGLLVTGYALLVDSASGALALWVITIIGAVTSASIGYSLALSARYLDRLNAQIPALTDGAACRYPILLPWRLLPGLFVFAWIVLGFDLAL